MELRPKQAEALTPLRDRWVHGDPPGSGKTPVGLRWLHEHEVGRALVIAPSNVVRHWGKLGPAWNPGVRVVVVPKGSTPKLRQQAMAEAGRVTDEPVAYITSYALFREDQDTLVDGKWDAVIFDEAHRLKNRSSLLHKAAAKVAGRTPLVDLSTGSPILNDAEETWSYLHLMEPKKYRSFWRWAGEHFFIEQTTFHGRLPRPITRILGPKPGALEAMACEFGPRLVARSEDEMLPFLDDAQRITYEVDLTPAERRLYDSLDKHGWAKEGEQLLVASNHLAVGTRLRQLASDWSAALSEVDDAGSKVTALTELVADLGQQQLLVFVSFKATAHAIVTRLRQDGVVAATFTGDDDDGAREAAKDDFLAGRVQVLIGTYGALAEGTDGLQHVCHHVALLDHDHLPEIERQAIGRLRRDGQQHQVIVHDFLALGTVDEDIAASHAEKNATAATIMGER